MEAIWSGPVWFVVFKCLCVVAGLFLGVWMLAAAAIKSQARADRRKNSEW
jgi:hypothetical protein